MRNIDEIIEQMSLEDLKGLKFKYKDELSVKQEDITHYSLNYWRWKYYTGEITKEEHNSVREDIHEELVYIVYGKIFDINQSVNWYEKLSDCECLKDEKFRDEIADLWLMRPESFQYEDEFKKLIFMLYVMHKDKRFRNIALEFYESNKELLNEYENKYDKEMFLIYIKDAVNYDKEYGIEKKLYIKESSYISEDKKKENIEEDWITKIFIDS